jgi:hypothetical protein
MIIEIEMKKVETYDEKKRKAAHLYLDGKCSLSFAVAVCFSDAKEAIKAINEIRDIFRLP